MASTNRSGSNEAETDVEGKADNFRCTCEYFNVDAQVIIAVPRLLSGISFKQLKPTLANLKEQADDHEAVKACFKIQAFQETGWLNSLNVQDLDTYLKYIEGNKNFALRVQMTVSKIREFKKWKDWADKSHKSSVLDLRSLGSLVQVTHLMTSSHQSPDFKTSLKYT